MEYIIFKRYGENKEEIPKDWIKESYIANSKEVAEQGWEKLKKHEYEILRKQLLPKYLKWAESQPSDEEFEE